MTFASLSVPAWVLECWSRRRYSFNCGHEVGWEWVKVLEYESHRGSRRLEQEGERSSVCPTCVGASSMAKSLEWGYCWLKVLTKICMSSTAKGFDKDLHAFPEAEHLRVGTRSRVGFLEQIGIRSEGVDPRARRSPVDGPDCHCFMLSGLSFFVCFCF